MNKTLYERNIQDRTIIHFLIGACARLKQYPKYVIARKIARHRGAKIGKYVNMPIKLALKANKNLTIGDHVSIETHKIDTRSPVTIGNYVIIGQQSEIITTSHYVDSREWEHKYYGITIEDYVWIPTKVLILPSCRKIEYGAVIGSGSVVPKNVSRLSIVSGNPAQEFKKRKEVHKDLIVESLLGGDFITYLNTWKKKGK